MNSIIVRRAAIYSIISGVGAAIIYIVIALLTGAKMDGATLTSALIVGAITLVVACAIFLLFTTFFARRKVS